MKRSTEILVAVAVLAGVAAVSSVKRGRRGEAGKCSAGGACRPLIAALGTEAVAAATSQSGSNAAAQQVVAYYFHGTVRCETCCLIEKLAKRVVEQEFSGELAVNRLVFTSVNYELPENNHFLTDYKLPCPSLVLVKRRDGKADDWKLLADTWRLVHEPNKLNGYVETQVRTFLNGAKQPGSTNESGLLPSKGEH